MSNPSGRLGVAHGLIDPHFGLSASEAYGSAEGSSLLIALSGVYYWLSALGIHTQAQVFDLVLYSEIASMACFVLALLWLKCKRSVETSINSIEMTRYIADKLEPGYLVSKMGNTLLLLALGLGLYTSFNGLTSVEQHVLFKALCSGSLLTLRGHISFIGVWM
jgi:hypothetical protein